MDLRVPNVWEGLSRSRIVVPQQLRFPPKGTVPNNSLTNRLRLISSMTKLDLPSATTLFAGVGNTPLFRLNAPQIRFDNVEILAKAEWMNPSGSVKDRAASHIIRVAEESGALQPWHTLLDSSSGNFGTSLAMIGAAPGLKVTLCVPSSVPAERKQMLSAFGAEVLFTEASLGSDGAIVAARELAALRRGSLLLYGSSIPIPRIGRSIITVRAGEIWDQSGGSITHFVACLGSSGTFTGIARRLRERDDSIRWLVAQWLRIAPNTVCAE